MRASWNRQKEGIDYTETFADITKFESLKLLCAIAAIEDLEMDQRDYAKAYQQAPLLEKVLRRPPQGFENGKVEESGVRTTPSSDGVEELFNIRFREERMERIEN
jgi:Reverse transcriptase (RNA-dependent DNA polymerase)